MYLIMIFSVCCALEVFQKCTRDCSRQRAHRIPKNALVRFWVKSGKILVRFLEKIGQIVIYILENLVKILIIFTVPFLNVY